VGDSRAVGEGIRVTAEEDSQVVEEDIRAAREACRSRVGRGRAFQEELRNRAVGAGSRAAAGRLAAGGTLVIAS